MKLVMHLHQSSNIFRVNRESLLQLVGDVGMKLVMHLHQSSNIFRVNRESLLLKGGDGVSDDGHLALHGGLVSLQSDGLALQLLVASSGALEGSLGVGELLDHVVLGLDEGGLGVGEGALECGSLGVNGGSDGSQRGGGTVGGGFGGLDQIG